MTKPTHRVVRALNNNAVLARAGEDEMVLVGRGIGFGRSEGDPIPADSVQSRFIEVDPEKVHFLTWVSSLGTSVLDTITSAVDLAADLLGELHPSVYLLLADHLAFAVQRIEQGEPIQNTLMQEIRAAFPEEYAAAEVVLHFLNANLALTMPGDEAAFITLHLNAARHGASVKQPLQRANRLADVVEFATTELDVPRPTGADGDPARAGNELTISLAQLAQRLDQGRFRRNAASRSIHRDLPRESDLARQIIQRILGTDVPRAAQGEIAYLAVFLHGWGEDHAPSRAGRRRKE